MKPTYWHRLHQLPGVQACPKHTVFLEDSNVAARIHNSEFASAEQAIQMVLTHPLDLSVPCHTALLQIAHDAVWLLSQSNPIPGFPTLKERYLNLLLESGFASYGGRIHIKKLKKAFNEYYSHGLLKLLQCEVDENKDSNWLSCIVKDLSINQAHHPLRHLLLIQFLECSLEEFFKFNKPIQPFGERPWPCLNKASNHFRQSVIQEYKITRNGWRPERPIGIFSCCNCGFTYTRRGPDLSVEDRFRITRIKSYGLLWEATLKNLWEDSSITWTEMAHKLGVNERAIQQNAARLGLTFPRLGPRGKSVRMNDSFDLQMEAVQLTRQEKLEAYRSKWLSIREENPEAGRRELQKSYSGILSWLRENDYEWLQAHLPSLGSSGGKRRSVDWEARDAQLAELVVLSASRLKTVLGRPVRVTKQAVGIELGQKALLQKNLHKLPLTTKILAEVIETREDYAVRRVEWAAECFRQQNINPAWSQLINLAGVYELREVPQVKEAIDAALQSLESLSALDRWTRGAVQQLDNNFIK